MTFNERLKAVRTSRWVRFAIVSIIFFLWVAWLGNWWVALAWILLFDIYITGYIPFTAWKKSKNKAFRSVMSWVDAIVYALILVYFVFAFIGQNYQIPSSSLEKTLLTGDYLWVNKFVYGPRVPMTPVHFPLVHNRLPILNTNSYLETPSLPYHRLKGLRNVEEGDIVVFNFPAGDSVATKFEDTPEYYESMVRKYGRETIKANPETFGKVIFRPVDRRQNFVKRAVGLPGQRIRISGDTIYIDGRAREFPKDVQFNYLVASSRPIDDDLAHKYGINFTDVFPLQSEMAAQAAGIFGDEAPAGAHFYVMPLTSGMIESMSADGVLGAYVKYNDLLSSSYPVSNDYIFPEGVASKWTLSNYGGSRGLLIPAKGMTVKLDHEAWLTYHRAIRNYEGHTDAYWDDESGKAIIDGKPADTYTFAMDYYFMMGDNRDNSQDSRFWGFVPEDHIIGTPILVLASFDMQRSFLDGKIRWNRILRDANPDK
ncbi:MAG: signal peptidase I [Muribaculaceae bacterium]|nr:signal peptidase I [Muribaculaceae bacterium]